MPRIAGLDLPREKRAEIALTEGSTIEIDAPRDRELKIGDRIGLKPRHYRIFASG